MQMENSAESEHKNLINELKQGREVAKQLQIHLNVSSSSHETREFLVHKILSSYDKALSMLKSNGGGGEQQFTGMFDSPRSLNGSPRSEDSDKDFKDQEHTDASRKRKSSVPRWTQKVQVCPGTGLEGPLDDGFNWRKYGQKDILGAKFPRGYYRCTHRNAQGCLATKQVQRSDEDPTIFEITYRGRHTCTHGSHLTPPSPEKQEPLPPNYPHQLNIHQPPQNHPRQSEEILPNYQTGLKVITEDLDALNQPFPSFHLPPTSSYCSRMLDNNLVDNFTPSFMSPTSESELSELISTAATSTTNSPTVGIGFPFGQMEFDPNFTFDNPRFFP